MKDKVEKIDYNFFNNGKKNKYLEKKHINGHDGQQFLKIV